MADVEILYDPITVTSGPVTLAVTGLDNVKVDSKFAVTQPIETKSALTLSVPETVKTDGKLSFSIPEPIKTEAKAAIDLQPVVVDQCLRLSLGALPPTLVCLPNRQRIGLTLFGVEVFGLTLDGEASIMVGDLPRAPHLVSASTHAPWPHGDDGGHPEPHGAEPHHPEPSRSGRRPPFVVRLGG